jgi:YD repeat-containing protein
MADEGLGALGSRTTEHINNVLAESSAKIGSFGSHVTGMGDKLHANATAIEANETKIAHNFTVDDSSTDESSTVLGGQNGKPSYSSYPSSSPSYYPSTPSSYPSSSSKYHISTYSNTSSNDYPSTSLTPSRHQRPVNPGPAQPWETPADYGTTPGTPSLPIGSWPTMADPIDIASGKVILQQTDVELPGVLPLLLRRTHISGHRTGRSFGPLWMSVLDQRVLVDGDIATLLNEDGMQLSYPIPSNGEVALAHSGPRWPLAVAADGAVSVFENATRRTFTFRPLADQPAVLLLHTVAGEQGEWITIDRASDGTPIRLRHHGGYQVRLDTRNGLVTALWLEGTVGAAVRLCEYRYDASGQLTDVINSSGLPMTFAYDAHGRLARWVARSGMWYEYHYDALGRCIRTDGADGFLSGTFEYDQANHGATFVDSVGSSWHYQFNDAWRVASQTDPAGAITRYEYDPAGNRVLTIDPTGDTVRVTYAAGGQATSEIYS